MDDTEELYQDLILDHYRHPRHRHALTDDEALVDIENPLCGDQIKLAARIVDDRLVDVRFDGHGCAISQASASIMCERLIGKTLDQARAEIDSFVQIMRGEQDFPTEAADEIKALSGVKKFPLRVKCATLSWHGLERALAIATTAHPHLDA
jgi:nitrogen fixation NifU-like protein